VAVRTAKLVCVGSTASQFLTLATVPAGETWIVKEIVLGNNTGTSGIGIVNALKPGVAIVNLLSATIAAFSSAQSTGRFFVLEPGDQLQSNTPGVNWNVWVAGTKLLGVAP
jgi:hypothetical protein